jgi:glutamate--cysteine ligase
MYCIHALLDEVESGHRNCDVILYNNDLSNGLPDRFKTLPIPAFPSPKAGWYARRKSEHFRFYNTLISEMSTRFNLDPWRYSAEYSVVNQLSINDESDRDRLTESARTLWEKIQQNYQQRGISESPVIFIKSDSGTYGMGITSIKTPDEILNFNRKVRNNLSTGKGSQPIQHLLLQEGIPTRHLSEGKIAEPCVYLVDNQPVGMFYRYNTQKSATENLNSQGMHFEPIALNSPSLSETEKRAYSVLARVSTLAAAYEIEALA